MGQRPTPGNIPRPQAPRPGAPRPGAPRPGNNPFAGSQGIKPGYLMPSSSAFSGEELRLVAAYLESLL